MACLVKVLPFTPNHPMIQGCHEQVLNAGHRRDDPTCRPVRQCTIHHPPGRPDIFQASRARDCPPARRFSALIPRRPTDSSCLHGQKTRGLFGVAQVARPKGHVQIFTLRIERGARERHPVFVTVEPADCERAYAMNLQTVPDRRGPSSGALRMSALICDVPRRFSRRFRCERVSSTGCVRPGQRDAR